MPVAHGAGAKWLSMGRALTRRSLYFFVASTIGRQPSATFLGFFGFAAEYRIEAQGAGAVGGDVEKDEAVHHSELTAFFGLGTKLGRRGP